MKLVWLSGWVALLALAAGCGAPAPKLVAVEKISGSVGFYDLEGRRLEDLKVGVHPHEMVFSPDRRFLYVTNNGILWMTDPGQGGNTISVIDLTARRVAGAIDLGNSRRPHGIDIDPSTGDLVATTENPSGLLLIDPARRTVLRRYDVHGQAPHMVLVGPGRVAYASNTNSGDVAAVDLNSGSVVSIPVGARPQGEVFSHDRKTLFVTCAGSDWIAEIDLATNRRTGEIHTGQGPVRVALTPDGGTLVYALQQGKAVGFADVKTGREIRRTPLTGPPVSLTLSADGKEAYSAVQEQDKVFVISLSSREVVKILQFPKGAGPDPVLPLR